ncbi:MAG: hypothetical protein PHS57_09520 [Alphaproteobacteria bacterium]|nr:hypothetical protein [Alphaproteobacteria bacterium]
MSGVDSLRKKTRALFLFGTSTQWKIEEMATIASFCSQGAVKVQPLSYYRLFHSAVEDQSTALKNLIKKVTEVEATFSSFRQKESTGRSIFKQVLASEQIDFVGGDDMADYRTYSLTDDTTVNIPSDIWKAILPELRKRVVPGSLKADVWPKRKGYVAVADIGPIFGAVGHEFFWTLVRNAASKIKKYEKKPLIIYNHVTCSIQSLSDEDGVPFKTIESFVPVRVRDFKDSEPRPLIPTSEFYLCRENDPEQRPLSETYTKYLLEESPRRKIWDQMVKFLEEREELFSKKDLIREIRNNAHFSREGEALCRSGGRELLKIVQPSVGGSFGKNVGRTFGKNVGRAKVHICAYPNPQTEQDAQYLIDARAMKFHFRKKDIAEFPDAIIFAPFDPHDEAARRYNLARLNDALVAKELDPALTYVPLIVMNYGGCYDSALKAHAAYARDGYSKEFVRPEVFDGVKEGGSFLSGLGVVHTPLQFCDVLTSRNWDALDAAAFELLDKRLAYYRRREAIEDPMVDLLGRSAPGVILGGTKKPDFLCGPSPSGKDDAYVTQPCFCVTVFASASSDRLSGDNNARVLAEFLSDSKMALCTGAGDQHTMGALIEGYKVKTHLTGASTKGIVKVETVNGRIPSQCDYWELHDDIGARIEMLVNTGDLYVSVGGGDGTGQETTTVLLGLLNDDPRMRGKAMIFVGDTPSMYAEIENILGADMLKAMQKNPYALEDLGIYLVSSAEKAKPIITAYYDRFLTSKIPFGLESESESEPVRPEKALYETWDGASSPVF